MIRSPVQARHPVLIDVEVLADQSPRPSLQERHGTYARPSATDLQAVTTDRLPAYVGSKFATRLLPVGRLAGLRPGDSLKRSDESLT
jgi:hypothetical protein